MMKRLLPLLLIILLTGCVSRPEITPENNVSGTEWNLASATEALAGADPIEPYNRTMFAITDAGMHWFIRPLGWVYGSILPKEVIQRIDYVSDNLEFPGRMLSCFLQAKWIGGCTEIGRFLVNSTVGIAGLFDPAEYYLGWYRRPENMGHAFAKWGIPPGGLFAFPFCSFTNPRDAVGFLFDSALDIKIIIPYAGSISALNRAVNSYEKFDSSTESMQDNYEISKMGLVGMRYALVNDFQFKLLKQPPPPKREPDSFIPKAPLISIRKEFDPYHPLVDTLRAPSFCMQHDHESWWIKTSLWNTDFTTTGKVDSIQEKPDELKREFQFWHNTKAPKYRNELVLIVPGIGSAYTGRMPRAMAELLYYEGYDTVVTSSTMSWLFAVNKDTAFPGYVPDDVKHLRKHLSDIISRLKESYRIRPKKIIIVGISLGGLQSLHLAQQEQLENRLGVSRFVAINPPVDLIYAINQFDSFAAASRKWTRKEFFDQAGDALTKYLPFIQRRFPYQPETIERPLKFKDSKEKPIVQKYDYHVYLNTDQASVLLGLSLRLTIRELIAAACRNGFVPNQKLSWSSRFDFYREHDQRNVMDYIQRYILPKHPGKSFEELSRNCGLHNLEDFLKNTKHVRILHNTDDPLLAAGDRVFLDQTLGQKLRWFDAGGHLGNMYMMRWQQELLKAIRD